MSTLVSRVLSTSFPPPRMQALTDEFNAEINGAVIRNKLTRLSIDKSFRWDEVENIFFFERWLKNVERKYVIT